MALLILVLGAFANLLASRERCPVLDGHPGPGGRPSDRPRRIPFGDEAQQDRGRPPSSDPDGCLNSQGS